MKTTSPRLSKGPRSGPRMTLLYRLLGIAGECPAAPSSAGLSLSDDLARDLPPTARRRTLVIGETVDEPAARRGRGRVPCGLNDNPRGQAEVG